EGDGAACEWIRIGLANGGGDDVGLEGHLSEKVDEKEQSRKVYDISISVPERIDSYEEGYWRSWVSLGQGGGTDAHDSQFTTRRRTLLPKNAIHGAARQLYHGNKHGLRLMAY
ncbi:6684_t:CDS:1, partial [Acaulospora colombiana]